MSKKIHAVDTYIARHTDWRGEVLTQLRELIHDADPHITEELKWDVPVFIDKKMICAISAFKDHVKMNFFKGALLQDPDKTFNNGFTSKQHRSIDFQNGDVINVSAIKQLIKEAVAFHVK